LLAALVFVPGSASACEPAPNHSVEVVEDDSPDCATIDDAFAYGEGALRVDNQCEEALTLEPGDCAGCGETLTVEPGETATMVVENREQASSPTLTWSVGDTSGEVRADVDWQDNSDACDGLGCRVGAPADRLPLWAASLLVLAPLRRRARVRGRGRCS